MPLDRQKLCKHLASVVRMINAFELIPEPKRGEPLIEVLGQLQEIRINLDTCLRCEETEPLPEWYIASVKNSFKALIENNPDYAVAKRELGTDRTSTPPPARPVTTTKRAAASGLPVDVLLSQCQETAMLAKVKSMGFSDNAKLSPASSNSSSPFVATTVGGKYPTPPLVGVWPAPKCR